MLQAIRHIVLTFIDFFHKPFSGFINKQTFRYLACGCFNAFLSILLYHITFENILQQRDIHVAGLTVSARIASFILTFPITFPIGFALARYIVFPESQLHGRVQLFRYLVLVFACIILNYVLIKAFAFVHLQPTVAYFLTQILVAAFSYVSQRAYTFKMPKAKKTA